MSFSQGVSNNTFTFSTIQRNIDRMPIFYLEFIWRNYHCLYTSTVQQYLYIEILLSTVGAIIIWSLADFVGLPTYNEWNCV